MSATARRRAVAALAVAASVGVLVAVSHRRHHEPRQFAAPAVMRAAPETASVPTTADAAERTSSSAKAAALRYLALSEDVVMMSENRAVAAQREAATAAAGPALVAELRARLAALHAAYPGAALRWRVGALAVRTTSAQPDRARVEVWYVGVLSGPNVSPWADWRLSRYDMAWERGAWRVAAESSVSGPRPAAAPGEPSTGPSLEAALAGFEGVAVR